MSQENKALELQAKINRDLGERVCKLAEAVKDVRDELHKLHIALVILQDKVDTTDKLRNEWR